MKILLTYIGYNENINSWYKNIAKAAPDGLTVETFDLSINSPNPRLSWIDLDMLWKRKDGSLIKVYETLAEKSHDFDVLINYNGANIHPEFLPNVRTFNVFSCFDDPESSSELSKPAASFYDAVFYGNIASRFQYESWKVKNLAWLPIFNSPIDFPSREEEISLFNNKRTNDLVLVCSQNKWRYKRLAKLQEEFPNGKFYGSRWPQGTIKNDELNILYRNSKIGLNIHNSTGPINRRLFNLPAFGILQICDNKTGLGQIFKLNKEVVGFDTIPEAVDLVKYYLAHNNEREEIAYEGYKRFWKDYHPTKVWEYIHRQLDNWISSTKKVPQERIMLSLPTEPVNPDKSTNAIKPFVSKLQILTKKAVTFLRTNPNDVLANLSPQSNGANMPFIVDESVYLGEKKAAYFENPPMEGVNMAKKRLEEGLPLDWPNILALNWAVTSILRDAKTIVEIGSGTGPFAEYASIDSTRIIHCFEEDDFAREKAIELRSRNNVKFFKHYQGNLLKKYDLLVSIEVFEHVNDLAGFLKFCTSLSERAIFTTPNRSLVRSSLDIGPPAYPPHVREFDPGEFYWILRLFYKEVNLYYMPDVYVPRLESMDISTKGTPLIAECTYPIYT